MNDVNDDYTIADHEFRDDDVYALGKYRLTQRWLQPLSTRGTLLNIGCGAGQFNAMAVDLGFDVRGFEPDPEAFALATANLPSVRCEVRQLGIESIPGERIADVIVMHDVLEHIEDETATVARIETLLKPDGVLVMSVPALPSLFGYHDEQLGHYRRYTRANAEVRAPANVPHRSAPLLRHHPDSDHPLVLAYPTQALPDG